jgi:isopentenyl-diphosphate delta-isomerase type 1
MARRRAVRKGTSMLLTHASDDFIVLVDDAGTPIGTAPKLEAHNSDTKLHLAFSVFLFNRRGELLLQQRATTKKAWPGTWSNSCCGHVRVGESTNAAAKRRLAYELGLERIELTITLPDFRYRAEKDGVVENEICPVLIGMTDVEPTANPSEVAAVKWVGWGEFLDSLDAPVTEISPWAIEEARLLAADDAFNAWYARNVTAS